MPSCARTSFPVRRQSEWDIDGAGDASIQGFATQMSVNAGSQIQFKIDTDAHAYSIKIYRLGYYQGDGARLIDTINPVGQPAAEPAGLRDRSRHQDLRLRNMGRLGLLERAEQRGVGCLYCPLDQVRQR